MGTAAEAYAETSENIAIADLNVIVGRELMNKGYSLMLRAEQLAETNNQQSSPANYWEIMICYRDLAEAITLYGEAMIYFEKNSVSTANYFDRVSNAWAVGTVPSVSSFHYLASLIDAGENLENATQQAITVLSEEYSNIFDNDAFSADNLNSGADYFTSTWHTPPELPDIAISLSVTERDTPGTMRIIVNHDSTVTVSDLQSYIYDFGDETGYYSERVIGGTVPTNLIDHNYQNNGQYTVLVTFTSTDGRTSSASQEITVTTAPVDVEYAPSGSRVSPDYSTDHVVGDEVEFEVRGYDKDGNLSHVIWSFDGPLEFLEGDDTDSFESDENTVGYEKMTAPYPRR